MRQSMAAWGCWWLELRREPVGSPSPSEREEFVPQGKSEDPTEKDLLLLGKHE